MQEWRKLFSSSKLNILTKWICWACSSFHTYMKLSDIYTWLVTHARSVHASISEVQLISKSLFWCKYYPKTFSFQMDLICQIWRLFIICWWFSIWRIHHWSYRMYESGPEIMTNSGPAPRFDDANQHFQENL